MANQKRPVAPDPAPANDETLRALVRDVVDKLFFNSCHPIVRDGIRTGIPKLLAAIPGPVSKRLNELFAEEARL